VAGGGRLEAAVVVGVLGVGAVVGLFLASRFGQLTWDETVYASQARSFVTDIPSAFWAAYRPPALPVVGTIAALGGFDDLAIRAVALALDIAALAVVYVLARQVWGRITAVLTLLAALAAPSVLYEFRQFHNDLPSAGMLLALMVLLWDQFERRSAPNRLLLAAGPLAAGAFYLRFGTMAAIGAIGVTALVLWWRKLLSSWRLVGATAVGAAALFAPHVLDSMRRTGSPIGILQRASSAADLNQSAVAQLRLYADWLPDLMAGPLPTLFLAAAAAQTVVHAAAAIRTRRFEPFRRTFWIVTPAVLAAGATILAAHANPRYMMFPLMLGLSAGGAAIVAAVEAFGPRLASRGRVPGGSWIAAVLIATVGATAAFTAAREIVRELRREPPQYRALAAARIAADAAGSPCHLASSGPPVHAWYSRCEADPLVRAAEVLDRPAGWKVYLVFREDDDRETDSTVIDALRAVVDTEGWRQLPAGVPDDGHEIFVRP
jgi:4-amino-4-deoxy-L-arabinose transferase-like glycosyltransferase